MGQADAYYKIDNWPQEVDRMSMLRLASEIPLLQHTLMRILLIGLSKVSKLNHSLLSLIVVLPSFFGMNMFVNCLFLSVLCPFRIIQ